MRKRIFKESEFSVGKANTIIPNGFMDKINLSALDRFFYYKDESGNIYIAKTEKKGFKIINSSKISKTLHSIPFLSSGLKVGNYKYYTGEPISIDGTTFYCLFCKNPKGLLCEKNKNELIVIKRRNKGAPNTMAVIYEGKNCLSITHNILSFSTALVDFLKIKRDHNIILVSDGKDYFVSANGKDKGDLNLTRGLVCNYSDTFKVSLSACHAFKKGVYELGESHSLGKLIFYKLIKAGKELPPNY